MIWHNHTAAEVAAELQSDSEKGLTAGQAAGLLEIYGKNRLNDPKKKTFFQRFAAQMKDFMVIILLIAAVVSIIVTIVEGKNDWLEPIVMIAIVVLNAVMGVLQESKAEAALDALKNLSAPHAKVIRDGEESMISAQDLVPGDVILLEAGDFIPADARLLQGKSLRCDESPLTGESIPAEKEENTRFEEIAPLGDRRNMVYSGCTVAYGRGKAMVTDTGMNTEMGKIATMLGAQKDEVTPLQKKLGKLGKNLGLLALAICAVIFLYGILTGQGILEMFMTAVALAVAAIPEGLAAIVTIVLAMGVSRMVKKNAIIRRLPAVETLGSASVICSDKTGTLTQNRMTLTKTYANGRLSDFDPKVMDASRDFLLKLAVLCNDGRIEKDEDGTIRHIGDPTETALIAAGAQLDLVKEELEIDFPRMAEIPFDSVRKLMTTVNFVDGRNIAVVKGAPDILLERCTNKDVVQKALKANEEMASQALRVLAVGYKELDEIPANPSPKELEQGLCFAGLVGMIDPPREEVMDAISTCKTAGITTVMITGDHVTTACAIAKKLGILEGGKEAVTGTQLTKISDEMLCRNIRKYAVFARVTPADKIRIVKAWQQKGEIVAMTGDGVNDAPALKAADIGCAMGVSGTDVAKGAADMVLTDDNFATIVTAVREGRGIFENIRKSVYFLLSCNLGEVMAVFVTMLIWHTSPLLPIQLLWINLVTDSLPALALGVEPAEYDIMKRKPRPKKEGIFSDGMGIVCALQGVMFCAITVIAYLLGRTHFFSGGDDPVMGQTMGFAVLAFSQLFHAFNARSRHSLFRIGLFSNLRMLGAFAVSALVMLAVLLIEPLQSLFGLTQLPLHEWEWILGLSVSPIVLVELGKLITWIGKKVKRRKKDME